MSYFSIIRNRASAVLYDFLKSLPPNPNNTWILPTNIGYSVPLTFLKSGKKIIFIDINPKNLFIDTTILEEKITQIPIEGILWLDSYGAIHPEQAQLLANLKQKYHCYIVQDKCMSFPLSFEPDNYTDLFLFSTGYAKCVELNQWGIGFYPQNQLFMQFNSTLYEEKYLTAIENICKQKETTLDQIIALLSTNWLNNTQIPSIDIATYQQIIEDKKIKILTHKQEINKIYAENIPKHIQLSANYQQWRFNILVEEKELLIQKIFKKQGFASSHYQPVSQLFGQPITPQAQQIGKKIINLFNDFYYSIEKALQTTEIIYQHLKDTQQL